jgi:hypothetical protein
METIKQITAKACKCTTKGAKHGFTLQNLTEALNAGLGIRKKEWSEGYFVYFKDGVLMNGNLNSPCREDKPRQDDFKFSTDIESYELVDRSYILLRNIKKAVPSLHNITDAKKIERVAKILEIDVDSFGC